MKRQQLKKTRKRKKRKLFKRIVQLFILILLVFASYTGYTFWKVYNSAYDDLDRVKSKLRDAAVTISNDPVSILIMGVEDYSSGGKGGRSDTLMVATFNPKDETMKLLSIPRDTRVYIKEKDKKTKINHAYSYGGKELTIETVEDFLNIPIDYYVTVNFEGFKNIIDILGGIEVDVPFDFKQNSDDRVAEKLEFKEGPMTLDGRHALAYARMRLEDPRGDLGRNERQQQVVMAVIDKLSSIGTITKIDKLTDEIGDNVETNMKVTELLAFYKKYSDFNSSKIEQVKLEGTPEYINGVSYYIVDDESLAEVQHDLQDHLNFQLNNRASLE
ncbi:LCP family protein [Aeribacillus composti]|uniref:LCP family protein n=1 Tax=Aeribacillus composti TaxID=1868734 RepID=UPI003D251A07